MDLGKKTRHQSVRVDPSGKVHPSGTVRSSAKSLDAMLTGLDPAQTDVVLEPTGMVWFAIAAYLIYRGCRVFRVDTWSAAQFRKFLKKRIKSDINDAEANSRMLGAAEEKFVPLTLPQPQLMALERLVRQRKQFVDDQTRTKLRLEAAADTYIPGLFDALGKDPLTLGKRVLLRRFMDPQKLIQSGIDGMRRILAQERRRVDSRTLQRVYRAALDADSLWGPLREEGCCPVDFEVAQEIISRYLDLLEDFENHVKALDRSIQKLASSVPGHDALLSCPGIGKVLAPAILANTGDVRRFRNANRYVSYCGLAPRKHQSGERDRKGQKITKAGKPILRKYYYLAAEKARRIDPELAAFYQRKIDQGKHHDLVVVAIAAKLARRVHAILRRTLAGDNRGYLIYDTDGKQLTPRAAAQHVRQRFPSKAARRRAERETDHARNRRAPSPGMSKRPPEDAAQAVTEGAR